MDRTKAYGFMKQLAFDAGAMIAEFFQTTTAVTWKDANNTPLTEADDTINAMVMRRIQSQFPDHGIIGEEGSNNKDHEYVWICDPLDGTLYFSHQIPFSTFMLALLHKGKPIMGVIYNPFSDDIVSSDGVHTYHNGTVLPKVTKEKTTKWLNIEYLYHSGFDIRALREALYKKDFVCTTVLSNGALCRSMIYGSLGAQISTTDGQWDIAPTEAIMTTIGGITTDFNGNPIDYSRPLAGSITALPGIHKELVALTKQHVKMR